jgi:HAD superfamily hydrolase (TIGR01509 family)
VPGAILFDFNGVLVDDERFHWRAFRETLAPLGIRLTWKRYQDRYLALDDHSAMAAILADAGARAAPARSLVRRKRQIYRRGSSTALRIEPRVARLIRALARRAPLAIVSGAARSEIRQALRRARLARTFRTVVAAEDVRRPKPHPEGYLRALSHFGRRDGRGCVAIEDSPGGVRAARAAGLLVVGVSTSYPAAALRRAGAGSVVPSLARLTVERFMR